MDEPLLDITEIPSQRLPPDPWQEVAPGVWEVSVYLEPEWWLEGGGSADQYDPAVLVKELPEVWSGTATIWWDEDRWRVSATTPTETYDRLGGVTTEWIDFPHPSHTLARVVATDLLDQLYVAAVRSYRAASDS